MVALTVRGATSADVDDERSHRRAPRSETPGSRVQSRGDSDTLALPAVLVYHCITGYSALNLI